MAFVDIGVAVAGAFGAESIGAVGAGMIGSGLVGAGTGALMAGLSGKNVLNGALMGGALGAVGGGIGGSVMGAAGNVTGQIGTDIASMQSAGASTEQIATSLMQNYGMSAEQATAAIGQVANGTGTAAGIGALANDSAIQTAAPSISAGAVPADSTSSAISLANATEDPIAAMNASQGWTGQVPVDTFGTTQAQDPSLFKQVGNWIGQNKGLTAAGVGAAILASQGKKAFQPNYLPAYTPQSAASMGLNRTLSANYQPTRPMATGGIADLTAAGETGLQSQPQQTQSQPVTMDYIKSLANQYGVSLPTKSAASGGSMGKSYNLGSYSDGGRLLKGPGDGMSDNIPATIADKQPARLADGEFVVPADVVSHLGNGSTDAGAKHLYKMMDNVRKARTGRKSQGKQIKADKYLPK
jgi:hypothetical protein